MLCNPEKSAVYLFALQQNSSRCKMTINALLCFGQSHYFLTPGLFFCIELLLFFHKILYIVLIYTHISVFLLCLGICSSQVKIRFVHTQYINVLKHLHVHWSWVLYFIQLYNVDLLYSLFLLIYSLLLTIFVYVFSFSI